MHRMRAGTPDETGWYPARSTHGKFSVLLPAPFNDFQIDTIENGKTIETHVVGTQPADGVKYSASCFSTSDPARNPRDALDSVPREVAPGQPTRSLVVAGQPAVDFETADRGGAFRVIAFPHRLCMLIVDAQDKTKRATISTVDAQRMFDSFRVEP
jgi:hypothetical protein